MAREEDKPLNHVICIDFETGGTDPQTCAITEVGAVAFRSDTFEEIWTYRSYIKPHYTRKKLVTALRSKKRAQEGAFREESLLYEEKALQVSGITLDVLEREGKDITTVASELAARFEAANLGGSRTTRPILLGQNITFDIGFLHQLAEIGGMDLGKLLAGRKDYFGNFQPEYEDTLRMARNFFALDESMTSHRLELVCERLDIELIEAHSALDDVYATVDVYKALVGRMRNGSEAAGGASQKVKTREHFQF